MLAKSDTLDKFAAAMAKVQEGIGGAVKGNINPAFKSKYADLSAVWEAWQVIGPANGFSVMQFPGVYDAEARSMGMDQLIIHTSGQWVHSTMSVPLGKVDARGYGSANTYARRYALAAGVGICPEDDDGNAASRPRSNEGRDGDRITPAQLVNLSKLAEDKGADLPRLCAHLKVASLSDLPAHRFAEARATIERKRQPAAEMA